ncbi:MAG: hypothetical protein NZ811_00105 [Gammaproteobacteria bacterium]|nr:hypothetical protein [Gammaproteobacteria bacterium]
MWIIKQQNNKPLTFSNGKTIYYKTKREALQDIKSGKDRGIEGEILVSVELGV